MSVSAPPREIGFVLFAGLTQLDLTGPWEVLTRLPNTRCHLLAEGRAPVRSASGLSIVPSMLLEECGQLDIVVVPGGPGHLDAMQDERLLSFLKRQEPGCQFLMAACTGTLVLAAAGLLQGYECTTHWTALHRLSAFGAIPANRRVVFDRTRATGSGVTAGIDLGLVMAAKLAGEDVARKIQLMMEYAPEPPFAGSPMTADPATVKALEASSDIADQIRAIDAGAISRLRRGARLIER
ncbi:Cyclohexyl-isocyanide hydratase [Neorhizobium galegae bv. orientalis str. HAMBI 540]|uniref:Cyclohexyl-isocyanide hydratase n=2 Tax=Neorhizobium galegae TaxID=399 RepID=A0A068SQB8_NEOGA|nr:DJ-1/PfpI family protein [Neorhizobium galegae]CDN47285.1 Cyclohexyl-isocyanide hydratase [Neorhizobium galegae bv. orientalis str. HAMBI 540]